MEREDQAPQKEGNVAKLSSQERPGPFPRCELNEYIFDDLQFAVQTRNLAKKREVPYGIQEEKKNANKILNSIICTHHRSLVGKGGPSSSERRQCGQAFVPEEARALSKMRAQ